MSVEPQQIGSYRLQQRLGYGSLGEVYLVIDMRTNQQNALKLLRAGATTSAQEVRFFEGEAKTISQFNHPHILPLIDYGETTLDGAQIPYVVTPFCPDGTLVTWLRQNSNVGIAPPQDVAAIIQQGAEALQYAHNHGIVHQDVKPSNFFLRSQTAGVPDLLVGDFGLAQITRDEGNANQAVRGTPMYIAPEQWAGQPVPATDQYALAVMAYQMLTGQSPFQGSREQLRDAHLNLWPAPPSTLNSALPADVDGVILRALAKRPGERFSSIVAFANALQQALPAPGQVVLPFAGALNNDPVPFYDDTTIAGNAVRPAQPALPPVQPAPQFVPQRNDIPPLPPPMQPSPPNGPSRRSTNTTIIVLVIALVVVLLIGGVVLFSVLHGGTGTLSPSAATATALTNTTATAQVDGQTATAGADNATATATAQGAQNAATATAQADSANATATAQANAHATATAQAGSSATATAATATATTLSQFNGNWVNDDSAQTEGVSRLNITNTDTTINVQAFGKCGTSDCLWGTQSTPYTGSQFTVTFTSNTGSTEQLVISLHNPQQLKVIDLSSTNGSTTYTFHKS